MKQASFSRHKMWEGHEMKGRSWIGRKEVNSGQE